MQRYILTYPGTMFELQYSDIDMAYVRSARHLHVSSFFLHRALRPRILDLFRQAKSAGLSTSLDTNDDPENKWDRDLLDVLSTWIFFSPMIARQRRPPAPRTFRKPSTCLQGWRRS